MWGKQDPSPRVTVRNKRKKNVQSIQDEDQLSLGCSSPDIQQRLRAGHFCPPLTGQLCSGVLRELAGTFSGGTAGPPTPSSFLLFLSFHRCQACTVVQRLPDILCPLRIFFHGYHPQSTSCMSSFTLAFASWRTHIDKLGKTEFFAMGLA